jgi:two-component system, LytTR family, sensor kinase
MRRVAGFDRQIDPARRYNCARICMVLHKSFRLTSFWQLQALGWICFYAWSLLGSLPDILRRSGALLENTEVVVLLFLGTLILHPICRWLLRRYPSWIAFELRAFVASVTIGAVAAFVFELMVKGIHHINVVNLAVNSADFPFLLFSWSSLYFSIKQWHSSSDERERLLRAEAEVREARLQALRYQLNPHFLFNSLNAVSTLVLDGEASAATKMLSQIGEFLRTSLNSQAGLETPLSEEMAFTEQYIAIEKTRLGERLQVKLTICPDTLDAMVPGMLLQPLVENAVRHGVASIAEGGKVAIESGLHEGRLRIVVRNSGRPGPGKQGEGENGIGKRNISERLQTLYGNDHQFSLEWPESGGCAVTVELPIRKLGAQEASPC